MNELKEEIKTEITNHFKDVNYVSIEFPILENDDENVLNIQLNDRKNWKTYCLSVCVDSPIWSFAEIIKSIKKAYHNLNINLDEEIEIEKKRIENIKINIDFLKNKMNDSDSI